MSARPVCRPHQHGDAARQPTAAVFCVFRLCAHARLAAPGPGGHALGQGAMRNPTREPAQGRRPDPDHRTQGLAVVLLGLPLPGRVHERRGGTLSRSDTRTTRITRFPPTKHADRNLRRGRTRTPRTDRGCHHRTDFTFPTPPSAKTSPS